MRDISAPAVTALSESVVRLCVMVELQFDSGTVRYWSGQGTLTYDGHSWLGTGELGSISPLRETAQMEANGYQLSLSGIPVSLITLALQDNYRDKPGYVYLGILDEDFSVLDTVLIGQGLMDTQQISEDGQTATITVNLESRLFDFGRVRRLMYTQEDQLAIDATDTGLEYVTDLENKEIMWG